MPGDLRSQRYREYSRQRQYQTNDILLENRIIFFGCAGGNFYAPEINDITANVVIQQMLYLQVREPQSGDPLLHQFARRLGDLDAGDL